MTPSRESDPHTRFLGHFLRHRDALYAYLLLLVRDRTAVEDLFQEVSTILWQKFDKFQEGTAFGAWARQIAFHKVRKLRRDAARTRAVLSDLACEKVSVAFDRVEETVAGRDLKAPFDQCLERLSPAARQLVSLRYNDGLQMSQIAHRLGRTVAGVNTALCRVRSALERCMRQAIGMGGIPGHVDLP